MAVDNIKDQLQEMTVGHITTICGIAVTRWNADAWEVGTFGGEILNVDFAAGKIVFIAISEAIG